MTKEVVLCKLQRQPEILHNSYNTTRIVTTCGYFVCSLTKRAVGKDSLVAILGNV